MDYLKFLCLISFVGTRNEFFTSQLLFSLAIQCATADDGTGQFYVLHNANTLLSSYEKVENSIQNTSKCYYRQSYTLNHINNWGKSNSIYLSSH